MADPHIVSTLTKKRNELEARIEAYQREIENVQRVAPPFVPFVLSLCREVEEERLHMFVALSLGGRLISLSRFIPVRHSWSACAVTIEGTGLQFKVSISLAGKPGPDTAKVKRDFLLSA
jgi:hypothetical protein